MTESEEIDMMTGKALKLLTKVLFLAGTFTLFGLLAMKLFKVF
ncbi:MAG: hypothetical protein V1936_00695 [Patescibacteria group bacterium]